MCRRTSPCPETTWDDRRPWSCAKPIWALILAFSPRASAPSSAAALQVAAEEGRGAGRSTARGWRISLDVVSCDDVRRRSPRSRSFVFLTPNGSAIVVAADHHIPTTAHRGRSGIAACYAEGAGRAASTNWADDHRRRGLDPGPPASSSSSTEPDLVRERHHGEACNDRTGRRRPGLIPLIARIVAARGCGTGNSSLAFEAAPAALPDRPGRSSTSSARATVLSCSRRAGSTG